MELINIADDLRAAQDEIDDLKNQRDYLIDKLVIGQKLALARCRFSMQFAIEKRWNSWILNSRGEANADAISSLQMAIEQIQDTKERIDELGAENEDIAEQNEALKEGAKEGEENLMELQDTQVEMETINEQLIEQAEQIKELLT